MNLKLGLLIALGLVVIYYIHKFGQRLFSIYGEKEWLNKNAGLEQAAKDKKQKPSHSVVEMEAYAQKIYNSKGFWNDDEQSIGSVFQTMYNELDVAQLIKAFGIKDGMALAGFLYDTLNKEELEEYVNAPLRGNGVSFQF